MTKLVKVFRMKTEKGYQYTATIIDDEVCQEASKAEIVRRWFRAAEKLERTGMGERELTQINLLMNDVNGDPNFSPA